MNIKTISIFYLVLFLVACESVKKAANTDESATADLGEVSKQVVVQGYLKSPSSTPIVIQRIGWSWSYNLIFAEEEGKLVKKNDPIFTLDSGEFDKKIEQLKGTVESNQLEYKETEFSQQDNIENQKNQIVLAELDLKKSQLMIVDNDTIPEAKKKQYKLEVEEKKLRVVRAKEKLKNVMESANKQMQLKKMNLEQNQRDLDKELENVTKTKILAPEDGILIYKNYKSRGGGASKPVAGSSVDSNTPIAEISGKADLQAFCLIPELDSDGIKPNVKVQVFLTALPQEPIDGEVIKMSEIPTTSNERGEETSSGSHNQLKHFEVWVKLNHIPDIAMPGMTLKSIFLVSNKPSVLRVPITSVVAKADLPKDIKMEGTYFVYAKSAKIAKWQWQAVNLGDTSLSFVEITGGLEKGDEVKRFAL